jgi:hypothetical protein
MNGKTLRACLRAGLAAGVLALAVAAPGASVGQPSPISGMTPEQVVEYSTAAKPLPTAAANTVPRAFGKPDLSGLWLQDQGILFTDMTPKHHSGSHPGYDDKVNYPPFTPEYQARYDAFGAEVKKNGYNRLYDCDPTGMPRLMANPFPMELVQLKDKLLMLFEYKSQIRRAYMDGRPHPSEDDYDASYTGHSTAKWEGETLVVDTTLIKEATGKLIQITGIEHSDQLHIVERVRFLNPNRIEWEITMIDPKVFTKPWVNRRSFTRRPLSINVPEYACTASELIKELGYEKKPKN